MASSQVQIAGIRDENTTATKLYLTVGPFSLKKWSSQELCALKLTNIMPGVPKILNLKITSIVEISYIKYYKINF